MQSLSWPSVGFYCIFSIFVFYQQLHAKNFRGASQIFALVLSASALLGMVTGLAYLAYYGWTVAWWAPIVVFVVGFLASLLGFILERAISAAALSLVAFIGWPVSAYFMFRYIPTAI